MVAKCLKNKVAGAPSANKAEEGKEAETAEKAGGNASHVHYAFGTSADHHFDWNTDLGATSHMTPNRHWFKTYIKM